MVKEIYRSTSKSKPTDPEASAAEIGRLRELGQAAAKNNQGGGRGVNPRYVGRGS